VLRQEMIKKDNKMRRRQEAGVVDNTNKRE